MREQRLRYCDVLLTLIRRESIRIQDGGLVQSHLNTLRMGRIFEMCDRFERVLASLMIEPLVWDGDYS